MKLLALLALLTIASAGPALAQTAPCSLVTQSEASTALGVPALPGVAQTVHGNVFCRYYSRDKKRQVDVSIVTQSDYGTIKGVGVIPTPGIGDEALYFGGSLYVKKGSAYARIGLLRTFNERNLKPSPELITLATAAAGRM